MFVVLNGFATVIKGQRVKVGIGVVNEIIGHTYQRIGHEGQFCGNFY